VRSVATPAYSDASVERGVTRFLEDVLDEMQVTDREYHHLNLSVPLTSSIVESVLRAGARNQRVLLIGGTMLLGEALLRLNVDLEIWRLPQSLLSPATEARVSRQVTAECLTETDVPEGSYGAVILPYVIESMPDHVVEFLRRARIGLADGGRVIVATRNQSRMENRIAALLGRPIAGRRQAGSLSLSWPSLPVYREYHRTELTQLTRDAGLKIERADVVDGSRLFLELEPMPIESYLLRKAGQAVRGAARAMRDTIVLELTARPGDDGPLPAMPDVSVAVSAVNGGDRLRETLTALQEQTYPRDRYEIVVLHDGRRAEVRAIVAEARSGGGARVRELVEDAIEGAAIRNQALREARAPIVAHTDDSSILPGDWIEAGVMRFDDDTAAISGPVFAGPDSHPKYLDVPGTRPDPAERERWRTDLFPIANVFYRTSAARAVGGFDDPRRPGEAPAFGWETDLAWRLERAGWQVRFCETVATSTVFLPPASPSPMEQVRRAEQMPAAYARTPEVRSQLVGGIFASRQTMYFDALLAGAALSVWRRNPRWLVASVPWFGQVSRRFGVWPPRKWAPSAKVVGKIGAYHLLWLAGFIKGSIKARRIVL
jgi:glycosyltransferase involved in cell wall biosynthesis